MWMTSMSTYTMKRITSHSRTRSVTEVREAKEETRRAMASQLLESLASGALMLESVSERSRV